MTMEPLISVIRSLRFSHPQMAPKHGLLPRHLGENAGASGGTRDDPRPRRGVVQITGSEKLNYFMPGLAGPEYMDVWEHREGLNPGSQKRAVKKRTAVF